MNRNTYKKDFVTHLNRMEKRFIGAVYAALRKQYLKVINDFKQGGIDQAKRRLSVVMMNDDMGAAVLNIHKTAGSLFANRTLSQLKKIKASVEATKEAEFHVSPLSFKYSIFGFNAEWLAEIVAYFEQYLLDKAVIKVSNTTRESILRILDKASAEGWSNDKIVHELSPLEEIRGRARMIVRTETVRASNYGVLLGADKYEYEVLKEWVSVPDKRRRHSHATVEGQQREIEEPFGNGLYFPGDPNGPAKEVINCRCILTMIPKRDELGRLIPKKNNQPMLPLRSRLAA
jgi:hypothetical protein